MKHKKQYHHGGNKKKFKKKENDRPQVSGRTIEVRNGNVNFAIKKLKKVLERMDFQKEVAKREYYEKPSATRKRKKDQAKKRHQKQLNQMISNGEWLPTPTVGVKHLKGKRSRRKVWMLKEKVKKLRR